MPAAGGWGQGVERCASGRWMGTRDRERDVLAAGDGDKRLRGVLAAEGWGQGIERCTSGRGMGTRD